PALLSSVLMLRMLLEPLPTPPPVAAPAAMAAPVERAGHLMMGRAVTEAPVVMPKPPLRRRTATEWQYRRRLRAAVTGASLARARGRRPSSPRVATEGAARPAAAMGGTLQSLMG